ncbi:hypothetical protein [Streptomyces sp. 8L]|uniref:hypothetical protein n=1 Tax=Streptomyces sp. 8L TaxID=2877242 RepID=UPI001CD78549|nr:hypothetical protein [Streptomyces sp. 8L]MCA1218851.1 hypothetical protein [Streptomyces sp. 8L]
MTNDQHPDDEQTTAVYQRADQTKFPTNPAGQQAAVEGTAAALGLHTSSSTYQRVADELNRQGVPTNGPSRRFAGKVFELFAQFERERRAEIIAAGGDPDEDHDPFEDVREIADQWAATAEDPQAREAFLDDLADRLDTTEVRALRLAAEAAAAVTPRLVYDDADHGVSAKDTAADLGVSESFVYRLLRQRADLVGEVADKLKDVSDSLGRTRRTAEDRERGRTAGTDQ